MKLNTVIQAIGHPIRRDIIKRLRARPISAGDLAADYDISKPSMSVHFKTLKEAELIYSERSGNHLIYHLNTTIAEEALVLIAHLLGTDNNTENRETSHD